MLFYNTNVHLACMDYLHLYELKVDYVIFDIAVRMYYNGTKHNNVVHTSYLLNVINMGAIRIYWEL